MLQVEKTSVPPGFTSCTAAARILRWYAAVDCSSRSVCRWTSLRERGRKGVIKQMSSTLKWCRRLQLLQRLPVGEPAGEGGGVERR